MNRPDSIVRLTRGELARRIGELCRDITSTAPVPAPFTYDDSRLAAALLRVVTAWNTHGDQSTLDPVALAYWDDWHDCAGGAASDPSAFREGAEHLDGVVGNVMNGGMPAAWTDDDE